MSQVGKKRTRHVEEQETPQPEEQEEEVAAATMKKANWPGRK